MTLGDGGLVISNFITGLSYPLPGCLAGAARGGVAAVVYPVGEDETAFYGGLQAKEKAATGAAFFIYYPLLSEYQVQPINRPNIFAWFGV